MLFADKNEMAAYYHFLAALVPADGIFRLLIFKNTIHSFLGLQVEISPVSMIRAIYVAAYGCWF